MADGDEQPHPDAGPKAGRGSKDAKDPDPDRGDPDKGAGVEKDDQSNGGKKDSPPGGKPDGKPGGKPDGKPDDQEKPRSRLPLIIGAGVVVVAIIVGVIYWLAGRGKVTTDDAYTDGRAIAIAANVSGYVVALYVDDNSAVSAGDPLLVIDPRQNQATHAQAAADLALAYAQLDSAETDLDETRVRAPAQLAQARAQLAQARAQQSRTERDYRRQRAVDQRATAAADVDQATEQLRSASASVAQAEAQVRIAALVPQAIAAARDAVAQRRAQVAQAVARLAQADVGLSYNRIVAPQDGRITRRNVEAGSYVQAGQQVFYLVTPAVWISANFKENQLTGIRPGDRVTIAVDAYPKLRLEGHVDSVQDGSGARFTEFPAENATGNFVKIVRRVPVKIVIDRGLPGWMHGLPLGISVEPTVYLK